MTKRIATLMSGILLVLGIAAFAGSALAGNGNGNGAGNAATPAAPASEPASQGSPPASPGNSANAPGQVKKSSATTSSAGGGSAIQTSTAGVKPSNATVQSKDTHAAAGSNKTKLYGNGQTAGQIAMQSGASSTDMLHGPGNSQPHKMALCPGGHEVDVHALKAKGHQKQCAASLATPTTSAKPTTSTNLTTSTKVTANVASSHAAAVSVAGSVAGATTSAPTATAAGAAPAGASPQGGVLGVTTAAKGQPAGGVLGAIEAVGQGNLPFTGFPLWLAVFTALSLVVFGLTLRRVGRNPA
jgi:hypothetical protein